MKEFTYQEKTIKEQIYNIGKLSNSIDEQIELIENLTFTVDVDIEKHQKEIKDIIADIVHNGTFDLENFCFVAHSNMTQRNLFEDIYDSLRDVLIQLKSGDLIKKKNYDDQNRLNIIAIRKDMVKLIDEVVVYDEIYKSEKLTYYNEIQMNQFPAFPQSIETIIDNAEQVIDKLFESTREKEIYIDQDDLPFVKMHPELFEKKKSPFQRFHELINNYKSKITKNQEEIFTYGVESYIYLLDNYSMSICLTLKDSNMQLKNLVQFKEEIQKHASGLRILSSSEDTLSSNSMDINWIGPRTDCIRLVLFLMINKYISVPKQHIDVYISRHFSFDNIKVSPKKLGGDHTERASHNMKRRTEGLLIKQI